MKGRKFMMVAKTMAGLEGILSEELLELGASDITLLSRAVSFMGDNELMYRANLWCRTALRILKPIATFNASNEDELYNGFDAIDWRQWMNANDTLAIDTVLSKSDFTHSVFVSQRAKDAIVDQFRRRTDKRPSVDLNNPVLRLNLHIAGDNCTVSADSSGWSLHKRGYRKHTPPAPINEVLAAGLIILSGWDMKSNFVDPMCGSGTILTEAALMALNLPPGYYRERYGFEGWPDFDSDLWENILDEIPDKMKDFNAEIIGSDISSDAVFMTKENIQFAKLHKDVKVVNKPISEFIPPEGGGVAVINPPYGERLGQENIVELYRSMGDAFKKFYNGYNVWVISSDLKTIKQIGLHPSAKIKLYNGPLECRFLKFCIYEGSKKKKPEGDVFP